MRFTVAVAMTPAELQDELQHFSLKDVRVALDRAGQTLPSKVVAQKSPAPDGVRVSVQGSESWVRVTEKGWLGRRGAGHGLVRRAREQST